MIDRRRRRGYFYIDGNELFCFFQLLLLAPSASILENLASFSKIFQLAHYFFDRFLWRARRILLPASPPRHQPRRQRILIGKGGMKRRQDELDKNYSIRLSVAGACG